MITLRHLQLYLYVDCFTESYIHLSCSKIMQESGMTKCINIVKYNKYNNKKRNHNSSLLDKK